MYVPKDEQMRGATNGDKELEYINEWSERME